MVTAMSEPNRLSTPEPLGAPAASPRPAGPATSDFSSSLRAAGEQAQKDWPVAATDAIVDMVHQVRDKTTGPALKASRAVVYGTVAGLLGLVALIIFVIGAVRALVLVLPDDLAYVAYLILGGIFTLAGAFLWSKRTASDA